MRLEGAGHFCLTENADEVNRALLDFLSAPAGGGVSKCELTSILACILGASV